MPLVPQAVIAVAAMQGSCHTISGVNRKPQLLPFAALGAGVLAISWSAIFVRWTHMPGIASAFYRLLFASCSIWILRVTKRTRRSANTERKTLLLAALGGLFFAGDVGLYNVSVLHTTAGGATFLGNNAPLVVGLLTWILTRKIPSGRFWAALLLELTGAWLIVFVDRSHAPMRSYGDLLAVLTSVCFALYLLATERLRARLDTLTLVAISTSSSALVLFLVAILTSTALSIPSGQSLICLIGLGLLCQLTGYFCLTYALGHLSATVSSVVMLAVAPLTAVWALLCFDEHMTALQWTGGALILLAVWIVSGSRKQSGSSDPQLEFL